MREDLTHDLAPKPGEAIDPREMARRDLRKKLPKRFYKQAEAVETPDGFGLALDGRPARTPGGNALATPVKELSEAVAAEWNAVAEFIDPTAMPITRIVNSALDGVTRETDAVAAEIVKYAGSDLLLYRAGDPASLVKAQANAWDPIIAWAREAFGARFVLGEGVMFVTQPDHVDPAMRRAVAQAVGNGPTRVLRLAALSVLTTLTGSALLALAVALGRLDLREAWGAAHADEDFQMAAWGQDAEALERRARRWTEAEAAGRILALAV